MMEKREIVVVGGGPAGLILAKFLAEEKRDFVLLEEHKKFFQKACGECVSTTSRFGYSFPSLYESKKGIENIITKFRLFFPNKFEIGAEIDHEYWMLDKEKVEAEIAKQVRKKGGEIRMGQRVNRIRKESDGIVVEPQNIKCKLIVGCDGALSIVRKFFGMPDPMLGFAVEGKAKKKVDDHEIKFYFGKKYSSSGYAWKFPKKNEYNIGTGALTAEEVRERMEFIKKEFGAKELRGAYLPASLPMRCVFNHGILVGDAASQIDCLTGGGINISTACAKMASEAIIKTSKKHLDYTIANLHEYEERVNQLILPQLKKTRRIALLLYKVFEKNDYLLYLGAKYLGKYFLNKL
ncbi:MAG: NAD(P)/FAD-dependent oxidoreductase [Candidatus Parvarchaeota archaeon]|nr:NAD(P)/FAD-dependent oxidoreductase [Candidatus Jingweiarchaeum tengchongense]MCW1304327.1 NAD(P)/FAD-dependent oxidoreductase [Candidatus Jingweiarchaeum tengchongense]MCW1309316.1 NAD(P)/FAD-dependent oxidoreductase [Candidatus Jingweiarchaeum tengchongense]